MTAENAVDALESRVWRLERQIQALEKRIEKLESRFDSRKQYTRHAFRKTTAAANRRASR
ncbi:MAG: hypothetical protein WCC94_03480 [Candidatus Bathyarchaeia archaeon]